MPGSSPSTPGSSPSLPPPQPAGKKNRIPLIAILSACGAAAIALIICFVMWAAGGNNNHAEIPTDNHTTPVHTEKEYKKGTVTETGYESEFLDLQFTAPPGYTLTKPEELDDICEMTAVPTGISFAPSVYVFVQESSLTEEDFIDDYKERRIYQEYTFEDDIITTEVAGQSYKQISSSRIINSTEMFHKTLVRKCSNDRIVFIWIMYFSVTKTEQMETLMQGFSKLSD
jgi:hypothetical protein